MPKADAFVPTSIGTTMMTMLRDIHRRRGIAIFSGPPGIGKTTALQAFSRENAGTVAIIKTERTSSKGVGARMLMQGAINAMRDQLGQHEGCTYMDAYQVRQQLAGLIRRWAQDQVDNRSWGTIDWMADGPLLTFVFDEAQNLSKEAIETLRFWNDRDRCFSIIPIGLAFVGNAEFALEDRKGERSVISQAVADRARYTEPFEYTHVENDDLRMILAAHDITDEMVVAAVLRRYESTRRPRSIRRLVDVDIADMKTLAGDRPITLETVR